MTTHSQKGQIAQLQVLSQLMLDARLADLHAASRLRAESLARLEALAAPAVATDLSDLAAAEVGLRYQRWADQRRAEINLTLARQTADWIEKRATAARAFGQTEALKAVQRR